jgi:hypothetical protein
VESASEADAVAAAIRKLQRDKNYQEDVWNPADLLPVFQAEEIDELNPDVSLEEGDSACVFYIDDESGEEKLIEKGAARTRPKR